MIHGLILAALFTPPKGWTLIPSTTNVSVGGVGSLGTWTKNYQMFVRVFASRNPGFSAADYANFAVAHFSHLYVGAKPISKQPITLCKGKVGELVVFRQPVGQHVRTLRVVFATTDTHGYFMTYVRQSDVADDAAAITSQASLCPSGESPNDTRTPPITVPPGYGLSDYGEDANTWVWFNADNRQTLEAKQVSTQVLAAETNDSMLDLMLENMKANGTAPKVIDKKPIHLCSADGEYVLIDAVDRGRKTRIEGVVLVDPLLSQMASYIRYAGTQADPAALKAIQSLCPTASPSPQASPTP